MNGGSNGEVGKKSEINKRGDVYFAMKSKKKE